MSYTRENFNNEINKNTIFLTKNTLFVEYKNVQ